MPTVDILIADDAVLFHDFVKSAVSLVKVDANFIDVTDGSRLFPVYEQHVPEITIIDNRLPNIDVLDFAKKILEIHPIASIIIFVDSIEHDFMKQCNSLGIEEVLFRTIGQFSFGSIIKRLASKKISKYPNFEEKSRQNIMNALTLTTLDKSNITSQYVKLTNASIQKQIEKIESLKNLGEHFDATIKKLSAESQDKPNPTDKNMVPAQSRSKSAPSNSPNFFMRELSNENLLGVLRDKIRQLTETRSELRLANNTLHNKVSELEEIKQELTTQKTHLQELVEIQAKNLLKTEKLAVIGELSARIAHDLRNPLSMIKNTSSILKLGLSDRLTENETEQWKRLDRGICRISHQIDDVLDFIKQRPLEKTRIKISRLLLDVFDRVSIPNNVKIRLPQKDVEIYCDAEKIMVVFVNLMLNAVQAMGDRPGTISFIVTDDLNDKNFVQIEVRDTGPGIPEKIREKIFDPLFTTRQIGTGLGLTSCKRIIENHGGTITFESKVGVGTSFFIKLLNKTEWDLISKDQPLDGLKSF